VRRSLRVLSGNEDATKIGLCAVAPVGQTYGLLGLSNSCEATHLFSSVHERFDKLFKRKAHLHHYEQYMDLDMFVEASESVLDLASSYAFLNRNNFPPPAFLGADLHAF
ncbi:putative tubulin, partial [Toxoplasma gondii TgCatPRC2]